MTKSVLFEAARKVMQIRQHPDEDEKTYGDFMADYAAESSLVYSDDMLVSYLSKVYCGLHWIRLQRHLTA